MRRTEGKQVGERFLLGDPALAERLALALSAAEDVDRFTHGLHTWPAGLHPDGARELIQAFPGASVLDPFAGGGTVLVEALAAGRRAVGRDLSSIAVRVSKLRTARPDEATLTAIRAAARRIADDAKIANDPPPDPILRAVRAWYAQHVIAELEAIRRGCLAADPAIRDTLLALFSSILVKTSYRKSDTSARREPKDRPRGTTAILFHKKAREYGRKAAALREAVPPGTPPADIAFGDARQIVVDAPVDLVLTSPPYPSTYDYLPQQHLRRVWLGETEPDDDEIASRRQWRAGEREARRAWRADTFAWTASAAAALRPGGHLVVVIGDGLAPGGTIDTSEPTEAAARAAGLESVARASVERTDFARDTARWEHVFAFRKP